MPEHDTNLDCGADTYEEAIIQLANLVDLYYDDNGEKIVLPIVDKKIDKLFILQRKRFHNWFFDRNQLL